MTGRLITCLLFFSLLGTVFASYEQCRDEPGFEKCADDEIERIITVLSNDKWEAEYRTKMNECIQIHC
ncbi:hypothetical protein PMAYCL1PPCAC_03325 [Pristionchus mayeri]|uniref:Uncharacterized protein n=1 Tax=Pristionchus mayeri TaxID=1317129 RepID=A0AAN4Z8I3_9BILA|nr:hypothetical protein PMAYCL1PPCAC_03325 [Pristionchus mayeri]